MGHRPLPPRPSREAEAKSHELRHLVGSNYSTLLGSAETIMAMSGDSQRLAGAVAALQPLCRSLVAQPVAVAPGSAVCADAESARRNGMLRSLAQRVPALVRCLALGNGIATRSPRRPVRPPARRRPCERWTKVDF